MTLRSRVTYSTSSVSQVLKIWDFLIELLKREETWTWEVSLELRSMETAAHTDRSRVEPRGRGTLSSIFFNIYLFLGQRKWGKWRQKVIEDLEVGSVLTD